MSRAIIPLFMLLGLVGCAGQCPGARIIEGEPIPWSDDSWAAFQDQVNADREVYQRTHGCPAVIDVATSPADSREGWVEIRCEGTAPDAAEKWHYRRTEDGWKRAITQASEPAA